MAKSAPKKSTGTVKAGRNGTAGKSAGAAKGGAAKAVARPAARVATGGTKGAAKAAKPATKAAPAVAKAPAKAAGGTTKGKGTTITTVPLDAEPRRAAQLQASQAAAAAREAKARTSPKAPSALTSARPQERTADRGDRPARDAGRVNPPIPIPAAVPAASSAEAKPPRKAQPHLSAKELEFYRDLLLEKRRELLGDMTSMEREALRTSGGSNLSTLPIHMADMGTDNYEQEFTLGLVEKDRNLLREINHALSKTQNGTYGICEGTGQPITKARLEAQPWARFSIEHARKMEKPMGRY